MICLFTCMLRQAKTVVKLGICHASRYIMEEAAVCMDTRAAIISLQCCTWPTPISCKSEIMGQNQSRLLSTLSPQQLYTVVHPEWLQLLSAKRAIQLASWPNPENYNICIDALHRPSQWNGILHTRQGLNPTIAFPTTDGTAYRNPAIPLPKKECINILHTKSQWLGSSDGWRTHANSVPSSNSRNSQTSWYHNLLRKVQNSKQNWLFQWRRTCPMHMPGISTIHHWANILLH